MSFLSTFSLGNAPLLAVMHYLFHDGGPYYIKTSSLICKANQWAGFYMIVISVMKELIVFFKQLILLTITQSYFKKHFNNKFADCT